MKTKTVLVLCGLLGLGFLATAEEVTSNLWVLYEASPINDRLEYLKAQKPEAVSDAFLIQALSLADSEGIEKGSDNEKQAKRSLAQYLCVTLGNRRAVTAANVIGRIPVQYKDPFLRGEAWLALAKLGDRRASADMIRELGVINTGALRGRTQEVLASYILSSLGLLKTAESFREVAKASVGWFTPASGLHELARKVQGLVSSDPTTAKLDLLRNDDDLMFREVLFGDLHVEADSALGGRAAEAVLSTLVTFEMRDSQEKDAATRLLKAALGAALAAPSPPAALATPLKTLLNQPKFDNPSKALSIQILAKIADPASLDILVVLLQKFNMEQKLGSISANEVLLVRELIQALGSTKKSTARAVLQDVRFSDYTPAIVSMAVDALAGLEP